MSTFPGLFVTLFVFSLALFLFFLSPFAGVWALRFEKVLFWGVFRSVPQVFSMQWFLSGYSVLSDTVQVRACSRVKSCNWFLNDHGSSIFTYVRWYLFLTLFLFLFSAIDFCCRYALLVFCGVVHESFVILMSPSEAFAFILVFSLPKSHFQTWWRFNGNFSCSLPVTFVYFCCFFFSFLMPYTFADDFKVKWFLDVLIFHVYDAN